MLGISQQQLAEASDVSQKTIADFETNMRTPYRRTINALRVALEAAGVEFIDQNGGGAGVRLRKSQQST